MKQVVTIVGKTTDGKIFRPCNWCKRIAGTASCFGDSKRLKYHRYISPIWISEEGVSGVEVDVRLKYEEPYLYGYVLKFAETNDLIIIDAQEEIIQKAS